MSLLPAAPLLLLLLLLLTLYLLNTAESAEFGVGFVQWPEAETVAVPGSVVRLPCSTNVTADKISWKYNNHFLHAPALDDAQEHQQRPPQGFEVVPVEGGSELVVRLASKEGQYRHQLGLYQCVAWFGAIALTSLPGRLTAALLGEEPDTPEGSAGEGGALLEVLEEGAARVECHAPPSVPDPTVTFYRDGQEIDLDNETAYHATPHGDLVVVGVGAWAEGVYSCSAHNPVVGRSVTPSATTRLKVLARGTDTPPAPPVFVTLSTVYSGHTGFNLTLLCLANGNPMPTVRWSRYGGTLSPRTSQVEDGSLLITHLSIEDEGTYLCHASNGVGKEIVKPVSVEVSEAPSLIMSPQSRDVEEGEALTLTCLTKGHPQPKVMWVFNGELVREDGNIHMTDEGLVIKAVEKEHAGIFQCFGHNPEGTVQGVAMVSVVPRTVTATPGATHSRPDFVSEDTVDQWRKNIHSSGGSGEAGGRRGSKRRKKGQKRKKAGTDDDLFAPGAARTRKGERGKKRGRMVPPSMPNITKVSDESVMVTWEGSETFGLPILFYKIQYKEVRSRGQQGSRWMTEDKIISPHVTTHEVTGLQTGRLYRFRIAAVYANNDNKLGPTSRRFLLKKDSTTQRPTYPPTITLLNPDTSTTVRLEWHYDPTPGIPIEGFFIHYREATVAGDYTKVTVLGPDKRSYTVTHLKANVSYDFKMQCFNMAGPSDFSNMFKKDVPGSALSTTQGPTGEIEVRKVVPVVKNEDPGLSSTHLYIILGAVLGLLLLIVVVSASVYTCRNKQSDDDTRSVKYEDTSLHIHRETSTYSLPQTPRCKGPNGYLPHQGITVTSGDDDKVVMESSVTENNNHSTPQVERCFTSPARRIASQDGCVDMGVKTLALIKTPHDTYESKALPQSATDT